MLMTKHALLFLSSIFLLNGCVQAAPHGLTPTVPAPVIQQNNTTTHSVPTGTTYQLTSHVLDINSGVPAANVTVQLMKMQADGSWKLLDTKQTNDNGRIRDFLPKVENNEFANDGTYKLVFRTAEYYAKLNIPTFYPFIEVNFIIKGGKHYHVPITLSPFGYSTYRGS